MKRLPPRSGFSLIQEDLVPNEWLVLVSCIMLNCTSRKQVQRVIPYFQENVDTPNKFLLHPEDEMKHIIKPLGFCNRRYDRLKSLAEAYIIPGWTHASQLPGIGEYASRAWELFCVDTVGSEPPVDGSLVKYWRWRIKLNNEHLNVIIE